MTRRHPKRRITGDHFASIPDEVLRSDACRTLQSFALRVLLVAAAQYRGKNNGDIAITWNIVQRYGIGSKKHLILSLRLLLERGLLIKTRQGGKRPLGPTLYALGWRPIDDLRHKFDPHVGPTVGAPNGWARWTPKQNDGTAEGPVTGLPGDLKHPVTGLPGDQRPPINGTAGSPPSRSWPGAPVLKVVSRVGP